jgi:hypothetical protein
LRAPRASLLVLAAACAAGRAGAQGEIEVISPRADAVAVTVYRDDLALVTETRTVTLPASPVTLVLDGVVETLLPQSAIVSDAARPLAESNFTFDRLTPRSLLEKSIGKTVTITRTNPATGRVTREEATILAAGEGVVLALAGGSEALYCSGLPERVELREVPSELLAKPQLAVKLAAGEAGARAVKVSYLAHGFGWSSDYVAHLSERGDRLRLQGWATLENRTGAAFEQAQVQVVAGALNVLPAAERGSAAEPVYPLPGESGVDARARLIAEQAAADVGLLRDCFASDLPASLLANAPRPVLQEMMMRMRPASAGVAELAFDRSQAVREELGDYQLYRIPWATDLGSRQTKQVLFLDVSAVRVERLYGLKLRSFADPPSEEIAAPELLVRWENTKRAGLGEPLPRGIVRVFERHGEGELFAGEAEIEDKPVGLTVELAIGRGLNVSNDTDFERRRGVVVPKDPCVERTVVTAMHAIVNNKATAVDLEIRHAGAELRDARVEESSRPMRRKYGDFAWRFSVPAGTRSELRYVLSAFESDVSPAVAPSCGRP